MKTTIRLSSIVIAFLSVIVSPQARAVCQEGCLTNSNTALGDDALLNNTGSFNTAIGANALVSNTTGASNTAIGANAFSANTTGNENMAAGVNALFGNTTGSFNTAIGQQALFSNTTGDSNTATGAFALSKNTTGQGNTANGYTALLSNSTGFHNTANGDHALNSNTSGSDNTASGVGALDFNTTGSDNTAHGYKALYHTTTSSENTANGANALFTNKTGNQNTANGSGALFLNRFGNFNTATGRNALFNNEAGASNIALGNNAGFNITGSQNIDIGNDGVAGESATIRIGSGNQTNTYIAGISGATVTGGVGVIVDTDGHLGTTTSSARFKEAIEPMDKLSEAILALQPVTFRYKHELDRKGIPQFGLVAEDVEKVNSDLVAHDDQGKPYTVRYEAVNAMLLNEFLKEHSKVETLEATVAQQRKDFAAAVTELKGQIQKVSAQLELNKPATQTAPKQPIANRRRVKNWEIIADNLSKARCELGLRVNRGFRRANHLEFCTVKVAKSTFVAILRANGKTKYITTPSGVSGYSSESKPVIAGARDEISRRRHN